MVYLKSKQEGKDGETEPLLPSDSQKVQGTDVAQPPIKSCYRFTRWKRVIKIGGLLVFAAGLLITPFIFLYRYFWLSFRDFGPTEPQDYVVPWRPLGIECEEHIRWLSSEAVENDRGWTLRSNFSVPLNRESLLLLVDGGVSGSVDFIEVDSIVNEAFVDLHVEYDPRTFGNTGLCTLKNPLGGVAIFFPREGNTARMTVHMPKVKAPKLDKMIVTVPNMEVNFPTDFGIKSKILAVESREAPLHVKNVECEFCEFKIIDGTIEGNFTVRDGLILKTKSGAINANIIMISNATAGASSSGPIVDITTTTGSINTNFTLLAVDPETEETVSSGGFYRIATRSHHAPLHLEIVDAPVDSILDLSSKNVWGPLKVWLHPTYQGWVRSEAFIGDTPLGLIDGAVDPSGSGKKRNLFWNGWSTPPGVNNVLSGEVWWGNRRQPTSSDNQTISSVRLKAIIGQLLVFVPISTPNAIHSSAD